MISSRIAVIGALSAFVLSACAGPGGFSTNPPSSTTQTNAAQTVDNSMQLSTDLSKKPALYWDPSTLTLKKNTHQNVRLYHRGSGDVRVKSNCDGKVRFRRIGFARIKQLRIHIFEVGTLRSGPLRCEVVADTKQNPLHPAVLKISILP